MDCSKDVQVEPLDLSKKDSTDSVEDVEPGIPVRFASPQCGLTNPIEKTGWPTRQEIVIYEYSYEASRETEDMEEVAARDEKRNTIQENYNAMERRVNTSYELPNPSSIPSQSKIVSREESVLLFERSGVRRENERSIATRNISRLFKKQKKDRPFKCEECDMTFVHKKNFDAHAKTHPGYKPYKCQECDKAFSNLRNLNRHNITHTRNETYMCKKCDKTFSRKDFLVVHEKIHTELQQYKCNKCNSKFSKKSNLKIHNDIHTGNKQHICKVCSKAFTQKVHMERHITVHTGDKPFKCTVCDKGFTRKDNLKKHELTHKNKS